MIPPKLKDKVVEEIEREMLDGHGTFADWGMEKFKAFLLDKVNEAYEMGRDNGIKEGIDLQKHMQ